MTASRTRILVESALTIALAAVLHFVRVWQMPAGGSVSLEMLPILVLALRRGTGVAVAAGALLGIVDLAIEPYVIHWVQFLLDYPVAFALLGLAGLWAPAWRTAVDNGRWRLALAGVLPAAVLTGALGRYVAHFVSGVVFFATSDFGGPLAKGASAFANVAAWKAAAVYSAVYNLYVPISALGCLAAMYVIMPVLERSLPARSGQ